MWTARNSLHVLRPVWDTDTMALYVVVIYEELRSIVFQII
jgi:hypothetical protein